MNARQLLSDLTVLAKEDFKLTAVEVEFLKYCKERTDAGRELTAAAGIALQGIWTECFVHGKRLGL